MRFGWIGLQQYDSQVTIVNNVAEINRTGDETVFVVSCETDSSDSMILFSVDKYHDF